MISLIIEAAVRSLGLAIAVGIVLMALRLRQPQVEKLVWVGVLAGSLAMPFLLQYGPGRVLAPLKVTVPEFAIVPVHATVTPAAKAYAALVYVFVASVLLARLTFAMSRIRGIRHRAVPLRDECHADSDVRVTAELTGPVTFGSTILIPESHVSWSSAKRLAILTHERTHVRNRDCLIQWIASAHQCLFWFSPLAWWLLRHLAALAEQTSDDEVLRENFDRFDYAKWLLESVAVRPAVRSVMSMASCGVARRVERILAGGEPSRATTHWQVVIAVFPVLILITIAAASSLSLTEVGNASEAQRAPEASSDGPSMAGFPSTAELMKVYPPAAKKAGRDGLVLIVVTVDRIGRAAESRIVSESPAGMGFGEAATQIARRIQYENPAGHPASITFKVKFALR